MRKIKILVLNFLKFFIRLFRPGSPFYIEQQSEISKNAAIGSGVKLYRSSIGDYSYISRGCFVESAEIGKFASIAADCFIGGAAHPVDWVSTSPVFCSGGNILKKHFFEHPFDPFAKTKIGNDVWIGYGCILKAGIEIADGAIIGAGSVVTKNVGPYEIWAGNPARFIRKRFDDDTLENLLNSHWWDFPEDKLKMSAELFNDPKRFLEEEK